MRPAAPRTVTARRDDGRPIAGASIGIRAIHSAATNVSLCFLPDDLARRFTVTTDSDGQARFDGLAPRDDIVAVRIADDGVGARDLEVTETLSYNTDAPSSYAVILRQPVPIAGRVVDGDGRPAAGIPVAVWTRGKKLVPPTSVALPGGASRTADDGSYRIAPGLPPGTSYRVVVGSPGRSPALSAWAIAADRRPPVPELVLRPLRTISGRVADRHGRPVAGVEVFQAGDGPEPTSARTDERGRFALPGLREGVVFLFARKSGFRFHGQMVEAATAELTLTREDESPAHPMPTLPDPIPPGESRALARQVLGRCLESVLARGNDGGKFWALKAMIAIDPPAVLERLDSIRFERPGSRDEVRGRLVLALAATDPDEAAAVAGSIEDAGARAGVLVDLADELPGPEKPRKLAVLDQAALQARAAKDMGEKLFQIGEVAERWLELGEVARARALFAEGRELAGQFADKSAPHLGYFAARLARVDLPGALRIAEGIADRERREEALGNMAARIAAESPADVEGVLDRIREPRNRVPGTYRACQKMAAVDPARARRIAGKLPAPAFRADALIFLAVGLKDRDRAGAVATVREALAEFDRFLAAEAEGPIRGMQVAAPMPLVEAIDPGLVPEFFWRTLATRPPSGDPRRAQDYPTLNVIPFLARYDREVAAALFRPFLAQMGAIDDPGTSRYRDFLAWSLIDPRAAAARLAAIAPSPKPDANSNRLLTEVADSLARPPDKRWLSIWRTSSGLGGVMFDRDVW
jgi:hypothetical protein